MIILYALLVLLVSIVVTTSTSLYYLTIQLFTVSIAMLFTCKKVPRYSLLGRCHAIQSYPCYYE